MRTRADREKAKAKYDAFVDALLQVEIPEGGCRVTWAWISNALQVEDARKSHRIQINMARVELEKNGVHLSQPDAAGYKLQRADDHTPLMTDGKERADHGRDIRD